MTRVNVLTSGFVTPNARAFLAPLLRHRRALARRGTALRFFESDADLKALGDCDVLILDSKVYSDRWVAESDTVLARIAALAEAAPRLFYFDITDSTGWDHMRALPLVTAVFKNQLLKDRACYLEPLYGYRLFTDFYHRTQGVEDDPIPGFGPRAEPVSDPALLEKLHLGWNSALADYGLHGARLMGLYQRLRCPLLLRRRPRFADPDASRPRDLTCRISKAYARKSVTWQRRTVAERLSDRLDTERVSPAAYHRELASSKIVLSPFGFGEICYRDYETFLAGAALVKPDMGHMETWPDLYARDETYIAFRWDLSDLEEVLEETLADDAKRIAVAREGQERYRRHLIGPEAERLFCDRFEEILKVGA